MYRYIHTQLYMHHRWGGVVSIYISISIYLGSVLQEAAGHLGGFAGHSDDETQQSYKGKGTLTSLKGD
jgi:hypothetical protein